MMPARKTYVVVRNRLVPLPDGLMFLVPTKLIPTATDAAIQPAEQRFAWGWNCCIRRGRAIKDESVAALVERHFGH